MYAYKAECLIKCDQMTFLGEKLKHLSQKDVNCNEQEYLMKTINIYM